MEREAGTAANLEEPSRRTASSGAGGGGGKGRRHGGHSRFGRDQNPGAPHGGGVGDAPAKGGRNVGSTARLPPPPQAAATCRPAPPHLPARSHPERSLAARTGPTGWATRYRTPAGGLGAARFGLRLRLLPRSAGGGGDDDTRLSYGGHPAPPGGWGRRGRFSQPGLSAPFI